MAGLGTTTKEVITEFKIVKGKQSDQVTKKTVRNLEDVNSATQRYSTTVTDAKGKTTRYTTAVRDTAPSMQTMTAHTQAMNMSILGLNMSLLGFSFAMMSSGIATKKQTEALMRLIGPMQMTMSLMNLVGSLQQIYILGKQRAMMMDTLVTQQMIANNSLLSNSIRVLRTDITLLWLALGAVGLVFTGLLQTSPKLRAALWALSGVLILLAAKNFLVGISAGFANAMQGPAGWVKLAIGSALAITAIGMGIAGFATAKAGLGIGLFKGGIIPSTTVSMGDFGAEAVIPLDSERGRSSLRDALGGSSGGSTIINNYITADRPSIMYRKMNNAMRKKRYMMA